MESGEQHILVSFFEMPETSRPIVRELIDEAIKEAGFNALHVEDVTEQWIAVRNLAIERHGQAQRVGVTCPRCGFADFHLHPDRPEHSGRCPRCGHDMRQKEGG